MNKILITGASGKIGTELVKLLDTKKTLSKLALRNPDKLIVNNSEIIDKVQFDFNELDNYENLFEGCNKLFLLVSTLYPDFLAVTEKFIETAVKKNISKIVFISSMGAEEEDESELFEAEMKLKNSALNYVILRPNWFMQNFNTFYRKDIRDKKQIIVPGGAGKVSFIDVRDIALASYNSLIDDDIKNREYTLTGNQSMDHDEIAAIYTTILDEKVDYESVSDEHYTELMLESGFDKISIRSMIWLYQAVRRGDFSKITSDLSTLINKEPYNFAQYVQDYINNWKS